MNKVEELKKFKELLDDGIITQEDFDKKKNELLANGLTYQDSNDELASDENELSATELTKKAVDETTKSSFPKKLDLKGKTKWIVLVVSVVVVIIALIVLYINRGHFVSSIVADQEIIYLAIGESSTISYKANPQFADNGIVFVSGDEGIVTIDDDGRIWAVGEGTTTVTIKASNGKSDTVDVCVSELYSNWSFYAAMAGDAVVTADKFISQNEDMPEIHFEEDKFEFEYGSVITGTWRREGETENYTLLSDADLSTYRATIDDFNGKRTLVVVFSSDLIFCFQ